MLAAWRWARAHGRLLAVLAAGAFVIAKPLTRCGPRPAERTEERREATAARTELVASHQAVKTSTAKVKRRITTTARRPDGAELVRVEEEEREEAAEEHHQVEAAVTAEAHEERSVSVRVVAATPPRLRLSAEVAADVTAPRLDRRSVAVGASVRVLGPLWLGVRVPVDDPRRPSLVLSGEW